MPVEKGARESGQQRLLADAWLEDRPPPGKHMLDYPGPRQDRKNSGLDEGGFSDPAHTGDHQEALALRGAGAEHFERFRDEAGAPAIDESVLEVESLEAAKRRTLPERTGPRNRIAAAQPSANPFAQVDLD